MKSLKIWEQNFIMFIINAIITTHFKWWANMIYIAEEKHTKGKLKEA